LVFESLKGAVIGFGVNLSKARTLVEAMLEDYEFSRLYFVVFRDELKDFRQETNRNFKEMAEKYGDISEELKEFRKTVKGFLDAFLSEYQKRTTT
jgi:hypothetical protein